MVEILLLTIVSCNQSRSIESLGIWLVSSSIGSLDSVGLPQLQLTTLSNKVLASVYFISKNFQGKDYMEKSAGIGSKPLPSANYCNASV